MLDSLADAGMGLCSLTLEADSDIARDRAAMQGFARTYANAKPKAKAEDCAVFSTSIPVPPKSGVESLRRSQCAL